jgi:hypothetical protein
MIPQSRRSTFCVRMNRGTHQLHAEAKCRRSQWGTSASEADDYDHLMAVLVISWIVK